MNDDPPKVDTRRVLSVVPSLTKQRAHDLAEAMRILEHVEATGDEAELDAAAALIHGAMRRVQAAASPPATFDSVLDAWKREGPLVHAPTGFAKLDELTGGGPIFGSRWYVMGAPDAGKTAFLVQLADEFLARGCVVGLLAVDEDPDDVITRFLQRRKFTRRDCEQRSTLDLDLMRDERGLDGLRLYDGSWTIERAADDIAALASMRRTRAMLGIDSIQTVSCDAERRGGAASVREAVTLRVTALRGATSRHRLFGCSTCEMGRDGYRSVEAAEKSNDLAAAKESGAIEYSARVLLSLRSVKDEPDLLTLRVPKNKHGPGGDEVRVALRIDRRLQRLEETEAPPEVDSQKAKRAAAKAEKVEESRVQGLAAAAALARVLLTSPGTPRRDLVGAMRTEIGSCSEPTVGQALHVIGPGVHRVKAGNAVKFYLVGDRVPEDVLAHLPPDVRPAVASARVPLEALSAH